MIFSLVNVKVQCEEQPGKLLFVSLDSALLFQVFDSHQSCFLRKCGGIAYSMALLVSVVTIAAGLGVDNATGRKYCYN